MRIRTLLLAIVTVIALGACAYRHHGPGYGQRYGEPQAPQVTVVDGQIQVGPDVLVFLPGQRNVTITWTLPADGRLRFAADGIVIEGELAEQVIRGDRPSVPLNPRQQEIVDCKRSEDGLRFRCLNRHTRAGVFKYTIRVSDGNRTIERDPFVANM